LLRGEEKKVAKGRGRERRLLRVGGGKVAKGRGREGRGRERRSGMGEPIIICHSLVEVSDH
jgi:hypothetical protein